MNAVDIVLLHVVGLSVILFLMFDWFEKRRKCDDKADASSMDCYEECDKEEKETVCDDDWDWEGIERTELEKMFGEALVFVTSSKNSSRFTADLKLKLHGLQNLVLQGPCHGSQQPMLFNLSARSNWNAWQKVGDMSREMAMEKYINTLVDAIPDWRA